MWSDGEYKYIFSIAKTYFLVSKFNKLKYEIINRWTKSDYINSKNNVLSIEKRGNSINLFINGFEVYSFHSLYNYLESVGFIVDSRQLVWFDYLKVLSLDEYNDTVFKDINESFDKNSNWILKENENVKTDIKDGQYVFEYKNRRGSYSSWIVNESIQSKNFILEVDAKIVEGEYRSAYGIMFGDNKNPYIFALSKDGYYIYGKYVNGKFKNFIQWKKSKYIKTDASFNNLKVKKDGNKLSFLINSNLLEERLIYTIDGNKIGFVVSDIQKTYFDNLKFNSK
jgi:hypothetical protein